MRFTSLFISSLAAIAMSATAFAGQMSFKLQEEKGGGTQFRLIGKDLCSRGGAKSFSMYKGKVDGRRFVQESKYVSKSGRDEWRVTKSCTINQELSQDLLNPGKALHIRTMSDNGATVENFYIAVPCKNKLAILEEQFLFYTNIEAVEAVVCNDQQGGKIVVKDVEQEQIQIPGGQIGGGGGAVVIVDEAQPEPQQSCSLSTSVDRRDAAIVNINAHCSLDDVLSIRIIEDNFILGETTAKINGGGFVAQNVLRFERNPKRNTTIRIEATSLLDGKRVATLRKDLFKEATFNYPVSAGIPIKVGQPKAQRKAMGRGQYYEFNLDVIVEDADIDENYPQNEILVQVINTTNGRNKVIREARLSTLQNRVFRLEGQYIEPLMFGADRWDEDGDLQEGENTFVVRVFDAYQLNNYIELRGIRVNIVK